LPPVITAIFTSSFPLNASFIFFTTDLSRPYRIAQSASGTPYA
jgi:hypothetical protein